MCLESDCPIFEPQDSDASVTALVPSAPSSSSIRFFKPLNDGTTSIQAVPRETLSANALSLSSFQLTCGLH